MPTMDETQLAALASELATDPEGLGYVSMNDPDAAAAMNAPRDTATSKLPVPIVDILRWLDQNGKTATLVNNLVGGAPNTSVQRFDVVTSNPHRTELDPENAQVEALFTELRDDGGFLDNADLAAIKGLAVVVNEGASRAVELGFGMVYPENVMRARAS